MLVLALIKGPAIKDFVFGFMPDVFMIFFFVFFFNKEGFMERAQSNKYKNLIIRENEKYYNGYVVSCFFFFF